MRKATAIFLLSIFLFGALMPIQAQEDLADLPFLIEHFQQHQDADFWPYLRLHYGHQYCQHKDAHDHSKLPFKGEVTHLHAPMIVMQSCALPRVIAPKFKGNQSPLFSDRLPHFLIYEEFWQPPRTSY